MSFKEIPLTQGKIAIVSEEDYESVSRFKWYAHVYSRASNPIWYAQRGKRHGNFRETIMMHSFIAGYKSPDHVDGDGLNNQRSNLRMATTAQNSMNKRSKNGSFSAFKGVSWSKFRSGRGKWRASIMVGGKAVNLGMYKDEEDAATAYNFAAYEHFGEFARLNVPCANPNPVPEGKP